jgi:hypothetical protein
MEIETPKSNIPDETPKSASRGISVKYFIQLTALSVISILLAHIIPIAGILFLFVSVVPQVILLLKKNYVQAAASWLVLFVVLGFALGWGFSVNYVLFFMIYGVVYGLFIEKENTPSAAIIKGASIACLLIFLWLTASAVIFKSNLIEEIVKLIKITAAISIGKQYDIIPLFSQIEIMDSYIGSKISFFSASLFGWGFTICIVGAWLIYYILSKYGYAIQLPLIRKFRLPETYIWLLISAVVMYLVGQKFYENNIATLLALNFGVVLFAAYFISGLGLINSLLVKLKFSLFLRFLMVIFLFFFFKAAYFFIGIGIFDVWVNFRKKFAL